MHAKTQTYSKNKEHTCLHVFTPSSPSAGAQMIHTVVDWANRKQLCVLIYRWGKSTTHTHTNILSDTHKVLRNVELINTHTHTHQAQGHGFCSLFVGTKTDYPAGFDFLTKTHSPLRWQVPWKLSFASNKLKTPMTSAFYPSTEPHRQGWQQHTSFLFVSFVQLFGSVHSSQPCQLKTCVSC